MYVQSCTNISIQEKEWRGKKKMDVLTGIPGGQEKIYIQAAYYLADETVIEREFGAYRAITDNYPKYVISMDKIPLSRDGIIHKNLIDFLLDR